MKLELNELNLKYFVNARRYLVLGVAAVAAGIGILFFGVWPQIQTSFELNQKLTADQKSLAALEKKVRDLEQVQSQELFTNSDKISRVLPSAKPLIDLLGGLNQSSGLSQVVLSDLQINPGLISTESSTLAKINNPRSRSAKSRKAGDFEKMVVSVTVVGSLDQINSFIKLTERMVPLVNVSGITLRPQSQRSGNVPLNQEVFKAELQLTTYFFTKSVAAAVKAPLPAISTVERAALTEVLAYDYPNIFKRQDIVGGNVLDLFGLEQEQLLLEENIENKIEDTISTL